MKIIENKNSDQKKKPTFADIYSLMARPRFLIPFLVLYASILFLLAEFYGNNILIDKFVLENGMKVILIVTIVISIGIMVIVTSTWIKPTRNFYDVDLEAKIEANNKLKEALNLEINKIKKLQNKSNKLETELKRKGDKFNYIEISSYDDFKDFYSTTASLLVQKANLSDEKASILLDRGISFTKFGISFFLFSIVAWQLLAFYIGFSQQVILGIVSTSFLFIFIEFLSAWFLKQYKNFTDTSTHLLKIKALLDRYMFGFLAIEKFPNSSKETSNAELILRIIEKEIKWPDIHNAKDDADNYAKEVVRSVAELIKSIKPNDSIRISRKK